MKTNVGVFDNKGFNPQAFGTYSERIPDLAKNTLMESGVFKSHPQISQIFANQTGSSFGVIPLLGLLGGDELNYDGKTDIEADTTKTFMQGITTFGRAKAWRELDFSYDITSGTDFMENVASQVKRYWSKKNQQTLISILKGIFSMEGDDNLKFVNNHTWDISIESGENARVGASTLNKAIQQACGDNKEIFKIIVMHSAVATNLENMNLLNYLKYTDAQGVQRDLALATWNGRTVLIDDSLPTEESGGNTIYTSYILGEGAFFYADLGVKNPYEMNRDPKTNGGEDTLYTRHRKCIAPFGISYTGNEQGTLSPTNAEFENGKNWSLVSSNDDSDNGKEFIDHRAIPIARIVSLG